MRGGFAGQGVYLAPAASAPPASRLMFRLWSAAVTWRRAVSVGGAVAAATAVATAGVHASGPDLAQEIRPFVRDGAFIESIRPPNPARARTVAKNVRIIHGRACPDLANEIGV